MGDVSTVILETYISLTRGFTDWTSYDVLEKKNQHDIRVGVYESYCGRSPRTGDGEL